MELLRLEDDVIYQANGEKAQLVDKNATKISKKCKIKGFMADGRVAVQYNKMLIYADRNEIVRIPNV